MGGVGAHGRRAMGDQGVGRGDDGPGRVDHVVDEHTRSALDLTHDLAGKPLAAPVLYPGSVERTSFAERLEEKGYLMVDVAPGRSPQWRFEPLPTRPMVVVELGSHEHDENGVRRRLARLDPESVVRFDVAGPPGPALRPAFLRAVAPRMNVTVRDGAARRS